MSYSVNFSLLGKSFVMPAAVAEKIKMFSEAQVKTAVWIFSNIGEEIDPAVIAKKIGKPVSAVEEALMYLVSIDILQSDSATSADNVQKTEAAPQPKKLADIPVFAPSYEQIVKRCKESPEIEEFLNELQPILGKTVGYDGQSVFLMMHDSYGLPFEVIYMLVNYCVSIGKASYKYMGKMARSWGEKEIDTIEKADETISKLNLLSKSWAQFTSLTGIQNPKPTSSQQEFLFKWVNEYKFSMEMIYEAYEYMADNCARISFKYMDAVLTDWYQKGIKNPDDIKKHKSSQAAQPKPAKESGGKKRSYDMDEFEQRANQLPVYKPKKGAAT
ncbi:MAG: DnaD domain protein [Clostridia bacterium]|nr:DnaD domain protein [Clostridia bacterium]